MVSNEDLFDLSGVSATSTPKKRRPTCTPKRYQEFIVGSKRPSAKRRLANGLPTSGNDLSLPKLDNSAKCGSEEDRDHGGTNEDPLAESYYIVPKSEPICYSDQYEDSVVVSENGTQSSAVVLLQGYSIDESQADEHLIINNDDAYITETNIEIVYENEEDGQPSVAYFVPTSDCIFVADEVENDTPAGPSSQHSGEDSTVVDEIAPQTTDANEMLHPAEGSGANGQPSSSSELPLPKIISVKSENGDAGQPLETYFVPIPECISVGYEVEYDTPAGPSSQNSFEDSIEVDEIAPQSSGEVSSKRRSAKRIRRNGPPSCSNNVTKSTETHKTLSHLDITVNFGSEDESDHGASDDDMPTEMGYLPKSMQIFVPEEVEVEDENPDLLLQSSSQDEIPWMGVDEFSPECLGPNDLFDFEWKSFSSDTVYPSDRREDFQAAVGPVGVFESPYAAFTAIWSPEFLQKIAKETNKYAQYVTEKKMRNSSLGHSSRLSHWQEVTVDELYVYFALLIEMGVTIKSDIKEYWTKKSISATPYFSKHMSSNRFFLISSCLHFVDNRTDISSLSPPKAKIYKLSPILRHLNSKFHKLYNLNRNIALDESLTQWKGILGINQFIKNKAAKIGIKTYEICDSKTGYLWRFKVHAGREDVAALQTMPSLGYTGASVVELLQGLENKGHCVWMDNFYNSPALARVLKTKGFDCAGTLRPNRRFVPSKLKLVNNFNTTVGESFGYTAGDVDVVMWRDKKCVAMISTYHGGNFNRDGARAKPSVVCDYNLSMGGVDKKDQMLSMYPMERKRTKIWYKKLFRRLLNASVLNSFILHRDSGKGHIRKHREFRRMLVDQLLERHNRTTALETPTPSLYNRPNTLPREALDHFPKEYGKKKGSNERLRYTCVLCKWRQNCYCSVCQVPLCIKCTVQFHAKIFDK